MCRNSSCVGRVVFNWSSAFALSALLTEYDLYKPDASENECASCGHSFAAVSAIVRTSLGNRATRHQR